MHHTDLVLAFRSHLPVPETCLFCNKELSVSEGGSGMECGRVQSDIKQDNNKAISNMVKQICSQFTLTSSNI